MPKRHRSRPFPFTESDYALLEPRLDTSDELLEMFYDYKSEDMESFRHAVAKIGKRRNVKALGVFLRETLVRLAGCALQHFGPTPANIEAFKVLLQTALDPKTSDVTAFPVHPECWCPGHHSLFIDDLFEDDAVLIALFEQLRLLGLPMGHTVPVVYVLSKLLRRPVAVLEAFLAWGASYIHKDALFAAAGEAMHQTQFTPEMGARYLDALAKHVDLFMPVDAIHFPTLVGSALAPSILPWFVSSLRHDALYPRPGEETVLAESIIHVAAEYNDAQPDDSRLMLMDYFHLPGTFGYKILRSLVRSQMIHHMFKMLCLVQTGHPMLSKLIEVPNLFMDLVRVICKPRIQEMLLDTGEATDQAFGEYVFILWRLLDDFLQYPSQNDGKPYNLAARMQQLTMQEL